MNVESKLGYQQLDSSYSADLAHWTTIYIWPKQIKELHLPSDTPYHWHLSLCLYRKKIWNICKSISVAIVAFGQHCALQSLSPHEAEISLSVSHCCGWILVIFHEIPLVNLILYPALLPLFPPQATVTQ